LPVLTALPEISQNDVVAQFTFLVVTFPLMFKMGSQFMPPLFEGSSLYMPTAGFLCFDEGTSSAAGHMVAGTRRGMKARES
jgi:Cu/Ag efflux pump CusA